MGVRPEELKLPCDYVQNDWTKVQFWNGCDGMAQPVRSSTQRPLGLSKASHTVHRLAGKLLERVTYKAAGFYVDGECYSGVQ